MKKKKILIIEEDKLFNNILKKYFENQDYTVSFSQMGHKYIKHAENIAPDIIIMDTDMPSQITYDFTKEIANNISLKGVPLILISASGQDTSIKKGISMGACDYISKPFNLEDLSNRVDKYIN